MLCLLAENFPRVEVDERAGRILAISHSWIRDRVTTGGATVITVDLDLAVIARSNVIDFEVVKV